MYENFVTDKANIIDEFYEGKINSLASEIEKETSVEIAVLTISSLEGEAIEEYSINVIESWGGVGKKDIDNGVFILVALNEREIRIDTGYGVEGVLPDIAAKKIIEKIIKPKFKAEKYGEGIFLAVKEIDGLANGKDEIVSKYRAKPEKPSIILSIYLILFIISAAAFIYIYNAKNIEDEDKGFLLLLSYIGMVFFSYMHSVNLFTLLVIITVIAIIILMIKGAFYTRRRVIFFPYGYHRHSRRRHSHGGFGGGWNSGGFGGFGGGSFGGGGASGRW